MYDFPRSNSESDLSCMGHWPDEFRRNLCVNVYVDSDKMAASFTPLESRDVASTEIVMCMKASDVLSFLEKIRKSLVDLGCNVLYSVMSVAGPISHDHVTVTNWAADLSERVIYFDSLPFEVFPIGRRFFLNDIEAASHGIIAHGERGSLESLFTQLWPCARESSVNLHGTTLVVSIGPGEGVASICEDHFTKKKFVIRSELSHGQNYGSALDERDAAFLAFVSRTVYSGVHLPEWEDFGSYRGLELAYIFLTQGSRMRDENDEEIDWLSLPGQAYLDIVEKAKQGDKMALEAFKLHYRFIMRGLQSMAMAVACQRVLLVSVAQVKNTPLVLSFANDLKRIYEDHPRTEWFQKVPVYVQKTFSLFPLNGGLAVAKQKAREYIHEKQMEDELEFSSFL